MRDPTSLGTMAPRMPDSTKSYVINIGMNNFRKQRFNTCSTIAQTIDPYSFAWVRNLLPALPKNSTTSQVGPTMKTLTAWFETIRN
ncbi:hypothetical protein V6N13_114280 [Hibiscus sabdariffa]